MSELSDAIDAFMAKYPDDVPLSWKRPARQPRTGAEHSLSVLLSDLVTASERVRR